MNINEILKAIKTKTFAIVLFDLVFLVLPGVSVIFLYDIELFKSLDTGKILLLSAAICAPLVFVNNLFLDHLDRSRGYKDDEISSFQNLSLGIFLAGMCIYFALAFNYWKEISVPQLLLGAALLDFILLFSEKIGGNIFYGAKELK